MRDFAIFFGILLLANCTKEEKKPTIPKSLSSKVQLSAHWDLISNQLPEKDGFLSALTLNNEGSAPLPASNWTIYFNFPKNIYEVVGNESVAFTRINGDFYKMEPTPEFRGLQPGRTFRIPFYTRGWATRKTDAPSGLYLVIGHSQPIAIPPPSLGEILRSEQIARGKRDALPVPNGASIYRENQALTLLRNAKGLVPSPAVLRRFPSVFQLSRNLIIYYEQGLQQEAVLLARDLEQFGVAASLKKGHGEGGVQLSLRSGKPEGYDLRINPKTGISISGSDAAGVFYGGRSLLGWMPINSDASSQTIALEAVEISDWPRFPYRGMHLDAARNFQKVETVKKVLDLMAFYKLNRFQFHLTDDEGWRLEIPGLPELTEVGGRRGHDLNEMGSLLPSWGSGPNPEAFPGSGFYTRAQFIEILKYARQRHIEVIPEIDLPGHARAAIIAMKARHRRFLEEGQPEEAEAYLLQDPKDASEYKSVQGWDDNVISVCRESTYRFLEAVIDEILEMFKEAEAPLTTVHTGGDEVPHGVWEKSPDCLSLLRNSKDAVEMADLADLFLDRFSSILKERGLRTAGWEEIGMTGSHGTIRPSDPHMPFRAYAWNNVAGWGREDLSYKLANEGYQVVLSNVTHLYLDLAHTNHPEEPGLYWAGFLEAKKTWSFNPMDIYQGIDADIMGNPIKPSFFKDMTRLNPKGKENILGIQGQLWSELIINQIRLEYMLFPRLLSLAERAWAPEPQWAGLKHEKRTDALQAAWNQFANQTGQFELPRLDILFGGVNYRIPPPGAIIEQGQLMANVAFPGLEIRYSLDGEEPDGEAPLYTIPVKLKHQHRPKLKAFDSRGRGSRTITPVVIQ